MSAQEILQVIRSGVRGTEMIAFQLSHQELMDLVVFVRSLNAAAIEQDVRGDVLAGQRLFWGKAGCSSCHMIAGRGGLLGPDLSNVGGELSIEKLSAAIRQPHLVIHPGYRRVQLVMLDGRKIDGLVKNESTYSIQIIDLDANFHFFSKNELQTIVFYKESLMPACDLPENDLGDLVAFLSRQVSGAISEPPAKAKHRENTYQ